MKSFRVSQSLGIVMLVAISALAQAQVYTQVHNFDWSKEGSNPNNPGLLAQGRDGNLYGTLPTELDTDGSVFVSTLTGDVTVLHSFTGADGNTPQSGLSLGFDGNFYGSTETGGSSKVGTVFSFGSGGLSSLHSFSDDSNGAYPWATPIQAPDGNIYGITNNGSHPGEIYRMTPSGSFSTIATAPSDTVAPLILGADGNMYGTSPNGGDHNEGAVFQLTRAGKLKIIHSFNTDGLDGTNPAGPVLLGVDGKLYGTTVWGGVNGIGTVFSMTTSGGGYKVLHSFKASEGTNPYAGLVQGSDKNLYGVAARGGLNGIGTLFKISTTGKNFADLHDFETGTGDTPFATPMLHTNGTIYGLAEHGGTPSSVYGVLYSFNAGLKPFASMVVIWSGKVGKKVGILGQGFNSATGVKFGAGPGSFSVVSDTYMVATVGSGATTGNVTVLEPGGNLVTPQVFKVTPQALGFTPKSGPVGTAVVITGKSLTQTTSVSFGGVKATQFTVNSDIKVTATVPSGAQSGKIKVVTKGGSSTAPGTFTVQ